MDKTELIYTVEAGGKILSIDGPWDRFASENGATGLELKSLLGNNLFHYISASGVVEAFRAMHHYLHDHPESNLIFNYRCDSPHIRRDMRMVMENCEGLIRYTSSVESTTPHNPPITVNYMNSGDEFVRMCSWCKKFKYPENAETWRDLTDLFEICPANFNVSHGICVECRQKLPYFKLGPITF